MKRESSYKEIEKDLVKLNKALKTIKKNATLEKAIKNIIENVEFQANELQKKDKEIEQAKTYMENVLEGLAVPLWIYDEKGEVKYVNSIFEQVLGYKKEECVGNALKEFLSKIVPKKDVPGRIESFRKRLASGEVSMYIPQTLLTKEGKEVPMLTAAAPIRDIKGNIIGDVVSGIDISELRNREEELEKERFYFRNFFNASPIPLTLIGLEGKRIDCNPAMERLTGRKKEKLVNVPVEATYLKEEQLLVRKKLVDETIEKGYMYGFETYFRRPDGTRLPIVANCSLLRDKEGKPSTLIYSATDITELKKREEELKKAQEYTRSLFYGIPNPTSILDLDGRRIDTTKATEDHFRRSRDEILGAKAEDFYVKEDMEKIKKTRERGKKEYSSCEATCIRGDGTRFPAILSFAPVRDKDGSLINIAFSATDITELKNKEKNLKNAILSFGKVLSRATKGDLSARVNLDDITDEYDPIAENINSMILATQKNITELRKRGEEVKEARAYAEAIIADIADPLWVTDKQDKWILVNEATKRIIGYKEKEILGKQTLEQPLFEFFLKTPSGQEMLKEMSRKIKAKEHVSGMLIPWLTKDSKLLVMSCSGEPLKDAKGNVIGGVFIGKDMSVLQRAGITASKALASKVEAEVGKNYELATLLFMSNATMIAGDSSLEILRGTVEGYNRRFIKNIGIKEGIVLTNMPKDEWPSFISFLLSTFFACIGPTTLECSEGIKSIEDIVEKVKAKYED
jgi:PAS domain S-box-containing protein